MRLNPIMLGWNISVFRLDPRLSVGRPDSVESVHGRLTMDQASALPELTTAAERIAVWQAGVPGIRWLDALVDANRAIVTATNGYPSIYYALAADVIPQFQAP